MRGPNSFIGATLLATTMLPGGCARYEYDLIEPPPLARHIGSQADTVFELDPLVYRLRSYDNHLVVRIFNPTTELISLHGDASYVVDPTGQKHPISSQSIAPSTYVKLILPPLPPEPVGNPPPVNPGMGIAADFGPTVSEIPYPFGQRYANDAHDWDWNDEGQVRISLTFQRGSQPPFTQRFLFGREKM
jgi:hypothetical protein